MNSLEGRDVPRLRLRDFAPKPKSARKGGPRLSKPGSEAVREVAIVNDHGMHARPVMGFVDLASRFQSKITVANISRRGETLDGKSAMQLMLLEATKGNVLRINAAGPDATDAVAALCGLIEAGFPSVTPTPPSE